MGYTYWHGGNTMPWKETHVMDARLDLILRIEEGDSIAEAARQCGVSRKTAHKWIVRYAQGGVAELADHSRAPLAHPNALEDETILRVIGLRSEHPTWGPRKLMHWLLQDKPELPCPAASTIGVLLKERGLTACRRPRRPLKPYSQPLAHCTTPNRVWCADFKGWFRTGDGRRCDPLTITDGYSRYLLRTQALAHPTLAATRPVFEATLREYGLPEAIRTDNGVPFASTSGIGLSRLAVGWIDLGITPERIRPGKPQENGRHERMHRTLKAETLRPPAETLRKQQQRFDRFREEYNHSRPHEALDYQTPASVYQMSPRPYPSRILAPQYDTEAAVCRVYDKGSFYYKGTSYFLTDVLAGRRIALAATQYEGVLSIHYRHVCIASLNLQTKQIQEAIENYSTSTPSPPPGEGKV
jgi:transposase InsO family protein